MNRQSLLTLYHYNQYANNLVLETVEKLSHREFTGEVIPIYPSIWALLLHMLGVETFFLACCRGETFQPPAELPSTPAALRAAWQTLDHSRQAYLNGVDEAVLAKLLPVQLGEPLYQFTRWQILLQAYVHSSHHRGELSVLLTHLGQPLPTLDIIIQFAQESGQGWPAR